jgi:hypothetical protein
MGILVTGTLPSGISVSNVYVSFADETIMTRSIPSANTFGVTACYRVFSDPSKVNGCNIRAPIQVVLSNSQIGDSIYGHLYAQLKTIFPDSTDYHENSVPAQSSNVPLL